MAATAIIEEKAKQVEEIKQKIQAAKSIVLVDYMGLTVSEDTELRKDMRANKCEYGVLKNRLVKKAFNDLGMTQFDEALNGPTAVAFSNYDEVAPAKTIATAMGKFNKIVIKCGMIEGEFMDDRKIKQISEIPSKEILLAKMLGSMQAPISKLAICINKIAEQKQQ